MTLFLIFIASFCMSGTLLSAGLIVFFFSHVRHPLGRAMTFMLMGEFLTMLACTAYSMMAVLVAAGEMNSMPQLELGAAIRLFLVTACVASSIHLTRVVIKIMRRGIEEIEP